MYPPLPIHTYAQWFSEKNKGIKFGPFYTDKTNKNEISVNWDIKIPIG